jgi:hypothetical protein
MHCDPVASAGVARTPHCGQKGSAWSIIALHPGQALTTTPLAVDDPGERTGARGPRAFDARPDGAAFTPATPGSAGTTGIPRPGFMTAATEMTRAPPVTIGLPQSMQNFDCASLS